MEEKMLTGCGDRDERLIDGGEERRCRESEREMYGLISGFES